MEKITAYLVRGMLRNYEAETACRKLGVIHVPGPACYLHSVYTEHENEAGKLGKQVDEICLEMESARLLKPLAE